MKSTFVFLTLIGLMISVNQAFSQVQPVKVDLFSHGSRLNAMFYTSSDPGLKPVVILLHGWPGNNDNPLGLAPKICGKGLHVLVFNYRGTYGSEGYTSLQNSAEDIVEAFRLMKEKEFSLKHQIDTSQIVIAGYSYGGGAMMAAAFDHPELKRLISIAGADLSAFIRKLMDDKDFRANYEERMKTHSAQGGFARMEGDISSFIDTMIKNMDHFDLVKNAASLTDRKILLIVGWDDTTSFMEVNALPLYRRLKELRAPGVSITAFTDNHSYSKSRDEIATTIADWIRK